MKEVKIDYPDFKLVGQSLTRVDGVSKLTGQAEFGEDVRPRGTFLHGRCLRSPHAHATLTRLDISKAEALPGVHAVLTAADLPDVLFGKNLKDERYLAPIGGRVLFVGDRVAAVAAETPELADEALALIDVAYEPLPPVLSGLDALKPDAPVLHPELLETTA